MSAVKRAKRPSGTPPRGKPTPTRPSRSDDINQAVVRLIDATTDLIKATTKLVEQENEDDG